MLGSELEAAPLMAAVVPCLLPNNLILLFLDESLELKHRTAWPSQTDPKTQNVVFPTLQT